MKGKVLSCRDFFRVECVYLYDCCDREEDSIVCFYKWGSRGINGGK